MSAYIVRLIGNKELVGVVCVDRLESLSWHVDECTDPHECEYAKLPNGGLFWMEAGATKVPFPGWGNDRGEDGEDPFGQKPVFSDYWWSGLYSGRLRWKPVLP